jgi:hypothetical protein
MNIDPKLLRDKIKGLNKLNSTARHHAAHLLELRRCITYFLVLLDIKSRILHCSERKMRTRVLTTSSIFDDLMKRD